MITMTFVASKKRRRDLSHCASAIQELEIIDSIATSLHIYRRACACVWACVCVSIEPSAAPGRGAPAKWQMVGINLANSHPPSLHEHSAHMAANSSTCLLPSQDLFCTLFAERKFSIHLRNPLPSPPRVVIHQHKHLQPVRLYSVSPQADYVWYRFPRRKYHGLKTNKPKEQDGPAVFEDRPEYVWSLGHDDHVGCGQWERQMSASESKSN